MLIDTSAPPDAADEPELLTCHSCQCTVTEADVVYVHGDDACCPDCADDHAVYCVDTQQLEWRDETVECHESGDYYRDDNGNVYHCEHCGNYYHESNRACHWVNDGDALLCESCVDYHCIWCDDIEGYAVTDYTYYSEETERTYYYEDNYIEAERNSRGLCSYSTNVLQVIGRIGYVNCSAVASFGRHLLYGVELETDMRSGWDVDDLISRMSEETTIRDYAIFKSDATCSGPEIVTLPADLASHRGRFDWVHWCKVLRPMAKGYFGRDNGIHIHINRGALGGTVLGKMLVFCNAVNNRELIEQIAQRPLNGWCNAAPDQFDTVAKSASDPCAGKYSVLNVTRNTVECRIFNSSLVADRIYKNLEFLESLVEYCRLPSHDHKSDYATPWRYLNFVLSQSQAYPYLSDFLKDRFNRLPGV